MAEGENIRLAVGWPHDRFEHGVEGVDDLTTEFSEPLRPETAKEIKRLAKVNDVPLRETAKQDDVVSFASEAAQEAADEAGDDLSLEPGGGTGAGGAYTVDDVRKAVG